MRKYRSGRGAVGGGRAAGVAFNCSGRVGMHALRFGCKLGHSCRAPVHGRCSLQTDVVLAAKGACHGTGWRVGVPCPIRACAFAVSPMRRSVSG